MVISPRGLIPGSLLPLRMPCCAWQQNDSIHSHSSAKGAGRTEISGMHQLQKHGTDSAQQCQRAVWAVMHLAGGMSSYRSAHHMLPASTTRQRGHNDKLGAIGRTRLPDACNLTHG
jgi:hypothetical protein